jgi:hypothetical protein
MNTFHAEGSSSNSSETIGLTRQFTQTYQLNISNESSNQVTENLTIAKNVDGENEVSFYNREVSSVVFYKNETISEFGATSKATRTLLTTTNTGIGETTLETNTTYGTNYNSVDSINSTYVYKTIISNQSSPDGYAGTSSYETVGVSSTTSTRSFAEDSSSSVVQNIQQTSQESFTAEIENFITSTFQDSFSFYETSSVSFNRFLSSLTTTSVIVNYSTSQGSSVIASNLTQTFQSFFEIPSEETSSYSLVRGKSVGTASTISVFVENYFNPLESFFALTKDFDYDNSLLLEGIPFSQAFSSFSSSYNWSDNITTVDKGDISYRRSFGNSIASSVITYTSVFGWTESEEFVQTKSSALDSSFLIEEISTRQRSAANSTALKVFAQNIQEASSNISSILGTSIFITVPTIIKIDPKNYSTTVLNVIETISTIGSVVGFFSTTVIDDSPVSSSFSSSTNETYNVTNSGTAVDSYRSAMSSGSYEEEFSFSSQKGLTHNSTNKRFDNIVFNKGKTFVENFHYAICPEFKAGFIGFEKSNYYGDYSLESFGDFEKIILNTKIVMEQNYKRSSLAFECKKILHNEKFYVTKVFVSSPPNEASYETFISEFSYFQTYVPNFSTSEVIENDSLKVFYYTVSLRNESSSTFEEVNGGVSMILLNSCSNEENYRIDRDTMGGFFPLTSQVGTLYYRGAFKATQVSPSSSSTFSFFNSGPNLSEYSIQYGNHISLEATPLVQLGLGSHVFY